MFEFEARQYTPTHGSFSLVTRPYNNEGANMETFSTYHFSAVVDMRHRAGYGECSKQHDLSERTHSQHEHGAQHHGVWKHEAVE